MKEFSFQYFTVKNTVAFDDFTVKIKLGPLRKYEFPFPNIVNYYLFDNNQYRSFFITYTDNSGKTKKVQIFSTPAEIEFNQMVAEFQAKIPAKSLNHLSEKEAFAAMKMANPKKWAPLVAMLIVLLITSGFVYPGLRHYFDFGFANATVQLVGEGKDLGSRNVHILGNTLDQTLEETTTTTNHGSTTTTKSIFIPLVGDDYKEGDPIKVMLKFDDLSDVAYQNALASTDFTGVIRNIAWEGMSRKQIDFFKDHFAMNLPTDPVLIEVTNKEHNDVYAIWVVGGITFVIGLIVLFSALRRK